MNINLSPSIHRQTKNRVKIEKSLKENRFIDVSIVVLTYTLPLLVDHGAQLVHEYLGPENIN